MENCISCTCIEQPVKISFRQVLNERITKFLTSFTLDGAEDRSKIK